ncbi:MAG: S24 family peptidase [Isosphaerales bacterium]
MARRKTLPESVRAKLALAERLATLRSELYGDRGGPEMARRLGIPVRTWYNYEGGVTVPAEVILKIIELTSVEAVWLLHGEGPRFRHVRSERGASASAPSVTIGALLRTALQLLEKNEPSWATREHAPEGPHEGDAAAAGADRTVPIPDHRTLPDLRSAGTAAEVEDAAGLTDDGSRLSHSRREWLAAQRDNRCVLVAGDSMAPIVADGASVAYAKNEEDVPQLDGKLVVAWLDNHPVIRWFEHCGHFALLRAQNPSTVPQQVLVDLEDPKQRPRFRRVLWVNTPH